MSSAWSCASAAHRPPCACTKYPSPKRTLLFSRFLAVYASAWKWPMSETGQQSTRDSAHAEARSRTSAALTGETGEKETCQSKAKSGPSSVMAMRRRTQVRSSASLRRHHREISCPSLSYTGTLTYALGPIFLSSTCRYGGYRHPISLASLVPFLSLAKPSRSFLMTSSRFSKWPRLAYVRKHVLYGRRPLEQPI
jgi:hypothetical protein